MWPTVKPTTPMLTEPTNTAPVLGAVAHHAGESQPGPLGTRVLTAPDGARTAHLSESWVSGMDRVVLLSPGVRKVTSCIPRTPAELHGEGLRVPRQEGGTGRTASTMATHMATTWPGRKQELRSGQRSEHSGLVSRAAASEHLWEDSPSAAPPALSQARTPQCLCDATPLGSNAPFQRH